MLKNCGPKGYPGFPEVGNFALPAKILKKGVTDMIRISDARMSGTAYGTVVLHTAPEAAAGGPLALVQNGDLIELDVAKRRIRLHVSDAELARRKKAMETAEAARRSRLGQALLRDGDRRPTGVSTWTSWSASQAPRSAGKATSTSARAAVRGCRRLRAQEPLSRIS